MRALVCVQAWHVPSAWISDSQYTHYLGVPSVDTCILSAVRIRWILTKFLTIPRERFVNNQSELVSTERKRLRTELNRAISLLVVVGGVAGGKWGAAYNRVQRLLVQRISLRRKMPTYFDSWAVPARCQQRVF